MRFLPFILFFLVFATIRGQEEQAVLLKGTVESQETELPIQSVHVLNLTEATGSITDQKGSFQIQVKATDTLYFTYLGYKALKVAVTNDMIKFGNAEFQMTPLAFALEEVIVKPYELTGYLDVDVRNVPINTAGRYSISGLSYAGYEVRKRNKGAISKTFDALSNPADFLHNIFGKKPRELRKLKKAKESNQIRDLLATKFDREILVQLLGAERVEIDLILRDCNYSDAFVKEANDLQILDAISECYEEYRILQL